MEFEQIHFLWLIPPVAILFFLWYYSYRRQWLQFQNYFGRKNRERLIPGITLNQKLTRITLLFISVTFLCIALVNPRAGLERTEITSESVNVLLAIDMSYSMTVEDRRPNRIELAKQRAVELIDQLPGSRFAFIPFAGVAEFHSPLTTDREAVKAAIRSSTAGMMPVQGTSFPQLLELSGQYLVEKGSGLLVIISDGETHDDQYSAALQKFSDGNFPIFTIGIGTDDGAGIPVVENARKDFRRDDDGRIIISRLETDHLREFSNQTGGIKLLNPSHSEINQLATEISGFAQTGVSQGSFTVYRNYHSLFIGLSILFLLFYLVWPLLRKNAKPTLVKTGGATLIVILVLCCPSVVFSQSNAELKREGNREYINENYRTAEQKYRQALESESRADVMYNLGNSLYQQGEYKQALPYFQDAAENLESSELRSMAHYNLGNALFELNQYEGALNAFRNSLIENPQNAKARNNFLFTKQLAEAQPPPPQEESPQSEDESDRDSPQDEGAPDEEGMDDHAEEDSLAESDSYEEQEGEQDPAELGDVSEENFSELGEDLLEQLLRIAEEDDRQSRRKINENQRTGSRTSKDW